MLSTVQEFNGGWLGSLTASFVRWWLVWCVGGGGVLVVVVKWCLVVPVTTKKPTPTGQMQPRQSHLGKKCPLTMKSGSSHNYPTLTHSQQQCGVSYCCTFWPKVNPTSRILHWHSQQKMWVTLLFQESWRAKPFEPQSPCFTNHMVQTHIKPVSSACKSARLTLSFKYFINPCWVWLQQL